MTRCLSQSSLYRRSHKVCFCRVKYEVWPIMCWRACWKGSLIGQWQTPNMPLAMDNFKRNDSCAVQWKIFRIKMTPMGEIWTHWFQMAGENGRGNWRYYQSLPPQSFLLIHVKLEYFISYFWLVLHLRGSSPLIVDSRITCNAKASERTNLTSGENLPMLII